MHAHAHGRLGGHSHSPKLTCGCVQSPVHRHVCTRIWGPIHSYTRVFACASVCICVHVVGECYMHVYEYVYIGISACVYMYNVIKIYIPVFLFIRICM